MIGTWILPGIGTFLGSLAGTTLGDMLSNDPQSGGRIEINANGQLYITGQWQDHGGNWDWLNVVAHHQILTTYNLVNLTGGRIDTAFSSPYLRLEQNDRNVWLTRAENTSVAGVDGVNGVNDLAPLVDPGVMELRSKIDLVGGDIVLRRAFENSSALNSTALAADLMMARDYRTYLDNAAVINALMAAQPESSFTAGWALTLLKARELNLDAGSAKDFQHGILAQLSDARLAERLDFAPSFDSGASDTLLLRHASGALAAGAGAISGSGNALDNWIEGNESANNLNGLAGADAMIGGAGDDTYQRNVRRQFACLGQGG